MPTSLQIEFRKFIKAWSELQAAKRELLKQEREARKIERESTNLEVFLHLIEEADKIKDPVLRKKATALAATCP